MSATSISKSERSFIQAGLLATQPSRADGRSLYDFRAVSLETGVAALASGSARLSIGKNASDGSGGTEVIAASRLEVETIEPGKDGVEGGRISCSVTCSAAAYPQHNSAAIDDLQYDLTTLLHDVLSHPSLHPKNLAILKKKKSWALHLDVLVLSDAGNVYDAIFLASRAALWDTKVPRTKSVEYKAPGGSKAKGNENTQANMDIDEDVASGFETRKMLQEATDFELPDYWDEGEPLDGRNCWPIGITLNVTPPVHFLDASLVEEAATPLRLLCLFSFDGGAGGILQGVRTIGPGEFSSHQIAELFKAAEAHAKKVYSALDSKLVDEETRRNQKAREKFAQR